MGCDAYASETGELEIVVRRYDDPQHIILGHIIVQDLAPKERLSVEYVEGEPR